MRKIVVLSFVSLDGVMQAPGAPEEDTSGGFTFGGWTAPLSDEVTGGWMVEQMSMPFDLLLGRKTYDIFAGYWPKQDPNGPIAGPFNKATKYVVSHGHPELTWEKSVLIGGDDDVVTQIRKLKEQDGPMLQVQGSSELIQTLLQNDLVDELWIKIFPVTLGEGKKLFGVGKIPAAFKLVSSKVSPSGVIFADYARAGEVQTGSFVGE